MLMYRSSQEAHFLDVHYSMYIAFVVNMLCCYNRFERSYIVLRLILVFDAELPASSNWFLRSNLHYQGSWC